MGLEDNQAAASCVRVAWFSPSRSLCQLLFLLQQSLTHSQLVSLPFKKPLVHISTETIITHNELKSINLLRKSNIQTLRVFTGVET